ncbi:hypothetical protein J15TS10_33390 [Paenibacillus woosongensis]|uniref:Uncharacterized protein n=1 Tax=Paenibacillus woosongensis TaxID=307580 RepID=A0ABQ4MUF8_9BACL|nr:hypothetical protein J15TS10_33390 [Paenibacillus woosongensis]
MAGTFCSLKWMGSNPSIEKCSCAEHEHFFYISSFGFAMANPTIFIPTVTLYPNTSGALTRPQCLK